MSSDFSTDHLFTPHEASLLLPDIKIKLKEILERKKVVDVLKSDVERYSLVGFETRDLLEKNQELEAVVNDLMTKVSELEDLGVKVRDIDLGLIDFPALRFGNAVYLCWRYGESDIEFWHEANEGMKGRKSLKVPVASP